VRHLPDVEELEEFGTQFANISIVPATPVEVVHGVDKVGSPGVVGSDITLPSCA
jgi:hypothetical protein